MRQLDFMGKRRIAFIASVLITVIAVGALASLTADPRITRRGLQRPLGRELSS